MKIIKINVIFWFLTAVVIAGCNKAVKTNDEDGVEINNELCMTAITEFQIIPCIKSASLNADDKASLDLFFRKYVAFTMDIKELANYLHGKGGSGRINMRISEDLDWLADLMHTPDYKQAYLTDEGTYLWKTLEDKFQGKTSDGQNVWFSFDENNFWGVIFYGIEDYFLISPAKYFTQSSESNFLIAYHSQDIISESIIGHCGIPFSFMEGVSRYLNDDNVYVIKGIALDAYEYGRHFELVEDMKGNFPENIENFIVWGAWNQKEYPFIHSGRVDDFSLYNNQDILIMLLKTCGKDWVESMKDLYAPSDITWFEKPEDFRTINCTYSLIKLSDDSVAGTCIFPWDKIWWFVNGHHLQSVPLEKFNELLQEIINQK